MSLKAPQKFKNTLHFGSNMDGFVQFKITLILENKFPFSGNAKQSMTYENVASENIQLQSECIFPLRFRRYLPIIFWKSSSKIYVGIQTFLKNSKN
jgi:hypothetical protein